MDRKDQIILVTGATGHQGGAVARALLDAGWKVRALTRDPAAPGAQSLAHKGAEVVKGDLDDRSSLDRALKGAYGVFAVLTPFDKGMDAEIRQGKLLTDSAKAAGIKHFVYSSVSAANEKTGIPHFESKSQIEKYLKSSGIPSTILRPVSFFYNFEMEEIKRGIMDGTLRMPLRPDKPLQIIAPEDFAQFVLLAFEKPKEYIGKEMDLAGEELTMTQAAQVFSRVIGRPVEYSQVPIEAVRKRSEDMAKMFNWQNKTGYHVNIQAVKKIRPQMLTLEQWLKKTGWAKGSEEKAA